VPQTVSPAALARGTVLAKRFRIEELIGSGGYASVYRVTDMELGYERAIKEVSDPDARVRKQFQLEAQLLINASHPAVPHGFHIFEDRGRMYFVMEFIRGKDLEELLNDSLTQRGRPLDEAQTLRWMMDVCDALAAMHSLSVPIIHRDIKPANIKITPEGRPVLIDFGLAKLQKRDGRATATAAQGVSPGFAPPEQYMAKGRTDARTDIYGLGATLYACLTGKDPPEAPARLLAQTGAAMHGSASLQSPRKLNPRISAATERIILKSLELSPAQRQQTALHMQDELSHALADLEFASSGGYAVPRRPTPPPMGQPASGKRVAVGAGGAMGGGAMGSGLRGATAQAPAVAPRKGTLVHPAAPVPRSAKQPAVEPRSGRQAAVGANGRSAKQPVALPDRTSARQPAVSPYASSGAMPAMPAPMRGATAYTPVPRLEDAYPQPTRASAAVAVAERAPASSPAVATGAWLKFGTIPLGGFAKWMLAFASVEMLWGALVLAVGIVALVNQGKPFPTPRFALIWGVAAILLSVLGGQAISRPVYRRGAIAKGRRAFQGTGLFLYTLVVHGVALWGATIFSGAQANTPLAIVAFMLFGVNVLVVGALSLVNLLG
jgi:tRNA A-37 threonylcarbamoyl transferase component Bud32